MKMKYVRFPAGFILFPVHEHLWHVHLGNLAATRLRQAPISAGFAEYNSAAGEWVCSGESESMGFKSLPEDSSLLTVQLKG